ncbi:MAG: phosphotransferase, partial [Candidatus Poribacteria bacterium]
TLDVLAQAIPPLLADTDALTLGGSDQGLSAAELDRLRDLAPAMRSACRALAGYAVPESLTHGDFVSVNIIARGGDTVFFDWSHSFIAHPFFDLPFVLPQPTAGGPSDFYALTLTPAIRARLEDAYLTPWTSYEPMPRLRQALALARPLAAVHYALTFYRYIVPTVEDAAEWGASVPRLLRAALADAESLRTHG